MKGGGGAASKGVTRGVGGRMEARSGLPSLSVRPAVRAPLIPTFASERRPLANSPLGLRKPLTEIGRPVETRYAGVKFPGAPVGVAGIKTPSTRFSLDRLRSYPEYPMLKPIADHEAGHVIAGVLTNSEVVRISLKPEVLDPVKKIVSLAHVEIVATPEASQVISGAGAVGENPDGFGLDFAHIENADKRIGNEFSSIELAVDTAAEMDRIVIPQSVKNNLRDAIITHHILTGKDMVGRDFIHELVDKIFLKYAREEGKIEEYHNFKRFVEMGKWREVLERQKGKPRKKRKMAIDYLNNGEIRIKYDGDEIRIKREEPECDICHQKGRHASSCPAVTAVDLRDGQKMVNPVLESMQVEQRIPQKMLGDRQIG